MCVVYIPIILQIQSRGLAKKRILMVMESEGIDRLDLTALTSVAKGGWLKSPNPMEAACQAS